MPPYCEITEGFVCDQEQVPSGQVDILLFHPLSFKVNIGASDCCLSESVFSAIEIKSRLDKSHFESSVKNLIKIRTLSRENLSTALLGATSNSEAYHFNTIGTVLFGYKGYTAETCCQALHSLIDKNWDQRPEVIYSLDRSYILISDKYLMWEGDGVLQEKGTSWIESLKNEKLDGYRVVREDCLLVLITILSKRIQCNYHLFPNLCNYVVGLEKEDK
ncbi:hypothetical protein BMS3Abin15_01227 [bacterium BMS3Abin15]|nr:hypothetical protein BMS3Abin15_01227 [bacterium BMS3Abin15]